nr:DNA repair protein RecO [Thiorhodococcus minor]
MHRRDYSDTSLLLEVFAAGEGRFPAIAKGARRKKSTASALLQPFQPLWLGATGRGEVRTLTCVEGAGPAISLQARAMLGGFYLNELLMRLLARNDPHDALFAFYQAALAALAEDPDLDTLLRQFELRLLDEIGYGMTLDRAASDGIPVQPDLSYVYDSELGVRLAGSAEPGPLLSGATLLALAAGGRLEAEQRREARALLRTALAPHLGDKPLQSRELYRRWFGADG